MTTRRSSSAAAAHPPPPPAVAPIQRTPRRLRRRPIKTPSGGGGGGGGGGGSGGRRSGPATPLLQWDLGDGEQKGERRAGREVSVRRLAAAVWRLRPPEEVAGAGGEGRARVGLEHIPRHLQVQLLKQNALSRHHSLKDEISSPISVLEPKSGELHRVELHAGSAVLPAAAMEKATKWEPESIKGIESDDAYLIARQLNLLGEQQGASYVSNLQMELQQARDRVSELEAERRSAKKKLDHLFKKLSEEKAAWRNREHEKVRAILDDMKADLDHEKKNRRRLEIINSKLVSELKEARMSAKQLLQEYEDEMKARELIEEVCNELAREVEEDKAEIEALKQDSMKLREEVDEERKMLQMAEVWREERVQMKLIDAKLTLDAKYSQLGKLQQDVEAFLRERSCAKDDIMLVREAEHIMQAIESVRMQEVVEFAYEPPPASEDILSIFEELRPSEESEIKEIEPFCYKNSSAVYEPEIQEVSPASDIFVEKPANIYSNRSTSKESSASDIFVEKPANIYSNRSTSKESETDDGSSWETISHEEMHGSSDSLDGSEPSVNRMHDGSISWTSGNDFEEGGVNEKPNGDSGNAYLVNMKQPKKKESAISKFWKSSRPKNGEICKKDAVEVTNGRSSKLRLSNSTYSTEGGIHEIGLSPPSVGQLSSPDSVTIQLNRGFRGCIECPRTIQKQSLKAKLLEARMESQKIQLRHVLKQKI